MKVIVGGVIEKDGKYLLVQEAKKKCYEKWNFPAGHLDFNESLEQGAIREIKEETGCDVKLDGVCYIANRILENDLFVMPSLQETFGVVYVEAMTQGLPVVYTRNEGFDGQFSNGIVGYAVDSHSSDELVYVIKNILEKYNDISERCLKNVEIFDWNDIAKKYEYIYQEVLST